MAKYKLEMPIIMRNIAENPQVISQVEEIAREKVLVNKNTLIEQFEEHKISREIAAGEDSTNISGTLGGYGNLFSFIGFSNNENPIRSFKQFLQRNIALSKSKPKTLVDKTKINFEFTVNLPSESEIANQTKMPWESGRSWLYDMERGISGFSSFLYGIFKSRSGKGIQSSTEVRSNNFKTTSYWTPMWKKFTTNLIKTK